MALYICLNPAVVNGTFSRLREESLHAVKNLPIPGRPDEAWRRLPQDVVKGLFSFIPVENSGTGTVSAAALRRPGNFLRAPENGEASGLIEEVLKQWQALESRRRRTRLVRPNDVEDNSLAALHPAHSRDIHILQFDGDGEKSESTGRLEFTLQPALASDIGSVALPLLIVRVKKAVEARLEIRLRPQAGGARHAVLQTVYMLEEGARLSAVMKTEDFNGGNIVCIEKSYQEAGSHLMIGGESETRALDIRDGRYALLGKSAELEHYSLQRPLGTGFSAQKTVVEHYAPYTRSTIEVRSVLDEKARALFVGTVKIPAGAEGAEAYEQHRTLLLSNEGRVESLPELEIVENDVSCSHAASISEIDREELFYLQSRGIQADDAQQLLTEAFTRRIQSKMAIVQPGGKQAHE